MTLSDFALRLRRVGDVVAAAERESGKEARALAARYSSGGHGAADLARAGHPYSRRAPNPAFDPSEINARTGRLAASWSEPAQTRAAGAIITAIANTAPEALFMAGTKRMIPRPLAERVQAEMLPARKSRILAAVRGLL